MRLIDSLSTERCGRFQMASPAVEELRPVWIQIWALRSRLEKQPTNLLRHHHYMRDSTLEPLI